MSDVEKSSSGCYSSNFMKYSNIMASAISPLGFVPNVKLTFSCGFWNHICSQDQLPEARIAVMQNKAGYAGAFFTATSCYFTGCRTPTVLTAFEESLKDLDGPSVKIYPSGQALECTGKPYLLKAQHSAFNISDSTTIPLTVQNRQITSFVPVSTDSVVDSSNKCLAVRTLDSTTSCLTRYAASFLELNSSGRLNKHNIMHYFSYISSK